MNCRELNRNYIEYFQFLMICWLQVWIDYRGLYGRSIQNYLTGNCRLINYFKTILSFLPTTFACTQFTRKSCPMNSNNWTNWNQWRETHYLFTCWIVYIILQFRPTLSSCEDFLLKFTGYFCCCFNFYQVTNFFYLLFKVDLFLRSKVTALNFFGGDGGYLKILSSFF